MSEVSDTHATGPWDVTDVDGPDGRLDFGAIWLRGVDGLQVQAQVDESTGAVSVGVEVVASVNHWPIAVATHTLNHPAALHVRLRCA